MRTSLAGYLRQRTRGAQQVEKSLSSRVPGE
jgi:hypothetical protein